MFLIYILIVFVIALVYLLLDFRGPYSIVLKPYEAFGLQGFRAKELIVQEHDQEDNLWATRGMILYRKKEGEKRFIRVAHVPTGLSYYWLNNFSLFRKLTNKPECIEIAVTGRGTIVALSAGYLWRLAPGARHFERSMKLRHYGFGVGRGILSYGIKTIGEEEIYWGEYFRNASRTPVRIYRSGDQGLNWEIIKEFEAGFTRHVHAIQKDPYTGLMWICMGDLDHESRIGWTDDAFKTITYIGTGSQMWRSSHLVFTEDAVYWGADTGSVDLAGIYRWDKNTMDVKHVAKTPGAILYGTMLGNGSLVFSSDREGFDNEKDHKTRLYICEEGDRVSEIEAGTWRHWKKGYRYSFAMLRFQRNQGITELAVSVINQKELPAGDMLLFEQEKTKEAVSKGMASFSLYPPIA